MDLDAIETESRGRGRAYICSSLLHEIKTGDTGDNRHVVHLTKQDNSELVQLLVRLVKNATFDIKEFYDITFMVIYLKKGYLSGVIRNVCFYAKTVLIVLRMIRNFFVKGKLFLSSVSFWVIL